MKNIIIALFCLTVLSFGNTIFSDDFTGTEINTNLWHIPTWKNSSDGTYLGRTQLRCVPAALPAVGNGGMSITAQSYNSTGYSIYGTDLISNAPFYVGSGLTITARLKVDAVKKGTVFAFFLYGAPLTSANTKHDEIDFEFVGNYPGYANTNIYGNEPLGVGNSKFVSYVSGSSITEYHTYQIEWLPNRVSWFVDGVLIRTVTSEESPIPQGPMYLHFNAWVPDASWPDAYSSQLSYVTSQDENQTWSMTVDSVSVQSNEDQVLTTLEVDPTAVKLGVTATQKFEASAIDQNENSIITPMQLTWASDNPAVANIDMNGLVTAIQPGNANITASFGTTKSAPAVVTVPPVSIVIKSVPSYGRSGSASGIVNGITDYGNYRVAVYINVYGGWWTKPSFASPLTQIKNGKWSTKITTGGNDVYAGEIRAYLVPLSFATPTCSGNSSIPNSLLPYPSASVVRGGTSEASVSPVLKKMTLSPKSSSVFAGGNHLQIIAEPVDSKNEPVSVGVSWVSSNPAVASVDGTGLVTPIAYGKTVITASVIVNPAIKATAKISVK